MGSLVNVVAGTAAFVGTHLAMSHPLRAPLVARLGEKGFLGIYTLVSLATLFWMVQALKAIGPEPFVWAASDWAWTAGAVMMLFASILLAGSIIGNPAMPGATTAPDAKGVFAITRHPMMWGIALWALVHAIVWPQPSVLVLCTGIALLALGGAAGQDAKKTKLQPDFWPAWRARTGFVPFTGPARARNWWPGWSVLAGGIALWLAATWLHPLAGAPAVGFWR